MLRSSTRLLALLLAVTAVAATAPGAVLAQGPGDDQYTDPFGELPDEEPEGSGDPPPQESPPPPQEPSAPPPPGSGYSDTPVASQPAGVSSETAQSETVTDTAGEAELARTGLPADFLAVLGLGLLCCGVLLRIGLASLIRAPAPHPFGGRSVLHQAPRVPGSGTRRR